MERMFPVLQGAAQRHVRFRIFVVAVDIGQQAGEIAEHRFIQSAAKIDDAVVGVGAQALDVPPRGMRHAQDRRQRAAMPQHVM